MAQEFQQPIDSASPRTQRMTADESRAVIALWQSERTEQTGLTDRPAVPDVAEGLEVTVEDVQRLLSEVRARRQEEERQLAAEQELSEVRLAEEERKLAEIQRQRAELRREQAEAARRQSAAWQAETWQAEVRPKPPLGMPRVEQHSIHTQKESEGSTYFYAAIIVVFVLFVILSNTLK